MHDIGFGNATGINNSGRVTGQLTVGLGFHAFLYDGTMHDLGTLGGDNVRSTGNAINSAGQITGESQISATAPNASSRAFLYDGAVMRSLGTLGGDFSAGL